MKDVITRFAPSPTGDLHLGSIRTALINYIFTLQAKSKSKNSKFLLRIEDTDKIRSKNIYKKNIMDDLSWLGIKWDDEVIVQSKRIKRHQEIAYKLLEKKLAFKCVCSEEILNKKREENIKKQEVIKRLCIDCENSESIQNIDKNFCIRIKIPDEGTLTINDQVQGKITINNKEIDNYVILRADESPTYMLSVVVDDYDMGVNNIIRGDDHLNNTFRQLYIYYNLGWETPDYAHIPLIHGMDGSKLSKRHGAINIKNLDDIGYLPQAIINNLILLGWSPKKNDEFIEFDEILKLFNIKDLSKSSSIFDYNKLNHFNNHYLKKESNYIFFEKFLSKQSISFNLKDNNNLIIKIFNYHKEKVKYYSELLDIINIYLDKNFKTNYDKVLDDDFNNNLKVFIKKINSINDWNLINLEAVIDKFITLNQIKFSKFGKPMRFVLTNSVNGISLSKILDLLGKNNTFIRLNNYINRIK
tara:strand:- start:19 stop:1431 length:1413 start_codon:yes stop_codon:yes gene_type:complete